jgi:L-threonylcarbamoyladenylate synthase
MTADIPTLLRPGGITFEQLEKVLGKGNITLFKKIGKKKIVAKSPGMKYKHYAPKAPVILVEGDKKKVQKKSGILQKITIQMENQ